LEWFYKREDGIRWKSTFLLWRNSNGIIMAKIVQSLTRASSEYEESTFQSLVRDLDGVITKLNTSFQDEVKQEIEAKSFFLE